MEDQEKNAGRGAAELMVQISPLVHKLKRRPKKGLRCETLGLVMVFTRVSRPGTKH